MTGNAYPIAAIHFGDQDPVDAILEDVARRMIARHLTVDGFLQRETDEGAGCCSTMHLESLDGQTKQTISQNLGRHSKGCRLNPQALAELSGPLMSRLENGADLLIINRFGKGESLGAGFRAVIEHAFMLGIPVLTAVRDTYWESWQEFTSGESCVLPPNADLAEAWVMLAMAPAGGRSNAA